MIFRANEIKTKYVPSESFNVEGQYKDIFEYIQKGYDITKKFKNTWLVSKKAKPYVTLICESDDDQEEKRVFTFNMKFQILKYYNRDKISYKLLEQLQRDFNAGKIEIYTVDGTEAEIKAKQ